MKAHAPATDRNRGPILNVLSGVLPPGGTVLEVASGSGQHAVWFARALPGTIWQPTDVDSAALESIEAWRAEAALPNLAAPIVLDVRQPGWEERLPAAASAPAAIVCINMIHISPWESALGLFRGGAALLAAGSPLFLYGPFRFGGVFTAESNAVFDASLRLRDPAWGVRDLDDVTRAAGDAGFDRQSVTAMPANNHSVVFRRR